MRSNASFTWRVAVVRLYVPYPIHTTRPTALLWTTSFPRVTASTRRTSLGRSPMISSPPIRTTSGTTATSSSSPTTSDGRALVETHEQGPARRPRALGCRQTRRPPESPHGTFVRGVVQRPRRILDARFELKESDSSAWRKRCPTFVRDVGSSPSEPEATQVPLPLAAQRPHAFEDSLIGGERLSGEAFEPIGDREAQELCGEPELVKEEIVAETEHLMIEMNSLLIERFYIGHRFGAVPRHPDRFGNHDSSSLEDGVCPLERPDGCRIRQGPGVFQRGLRRAGAFHLVRQDHGRLSVRAGLLSQVRESSLVVEDVFLSLGRVCSSSRSCRLRRG